MTAGASRSAESVEARDIAALRHDVETLAVALSWWSTRDDSKPQPEVREYANLAVSTVDSLSRLLYQTRSRLLGEMRQSDDAAMVRTEKLLARFRDDKTAKPCTFLVPGGCHGSCDGRPDCQGAYVESVPVQCASTLDDSDHTHRCALHVEDGPHNDSNHICAIDGCPRQWNGGAL